MGSRDHSWECEVCGFAKGGLNDLTCACEQSYVMLVCGLDTLAHNLSIAAALCRAFALGYIDGADYVSTTGKLTISDGAPWRPGCDKEAP
jgi:hypothetical protein